MAYLIDANILLRGVHAAHPMHPDATRAVDTLLANGEELCIVPQTIYEFWTVATRPTTARDGLGMSPAEAQTEVEDIRRAFIFLPDTSAVYDEWIRFRRTW